MEKGDIIERGLIKMGLWGGLKKERGLINFMLLKGGGILEGMGAYLRGGLNRGFTVSEFLFFRS